MSEEISVGVRILLERIKSNPEEVMDDYGKWGQLREAVYAYKEEGHRRPWIRGLRQDEIDLLYEAFSSHARQIFDDYVLSHVLGVEDEKEEYVGQAALNKAMAQRGLLSNFPPPVRDPMYNPHQNSITSYNNPNSITLQGNTVVQGTLDAEPSPASLQKIKKGLGL